MSFNILREVVEQRFADLWTATPIARVDFTDNRNFTPPQSDSWVRVIANVTETENAEVGANFQRSLGLITVQCFVPIDTGEKELSDLVDAVKTVYQNKNFGGVACYTTSPVRVGDRDNWYQMNAVTNFKYDVFT